MCINGTGAHRQNLGDADGRQGVATLNHIDNVLAQHLSNTGGDRGGIRRETGEPLLKERRKRHDTGYRSPSAAAPITSPCCGNTTGRTSPGCSGQRTDEGTDGRPDQGPGQPGEEPYGHGGSTYLPFAAEDPGRSGSRSRGRTRHSEEDDRADCTAHRAGGGRGEETDYEPTPEDQGTGGRGIRGLLPDGNPDFATGTPSMT